MSKPVAYLSGPMRGLSYEDADAWRQEARRGLWPDIATLSPLRGKGNLRGQPIPATAQSPLSTAEAIVARDFRDVTRSDAVLVNLLGAKEISIGTVAEIAWAHAARTPVVLVMEHAPGLNPHNHPMVTVPCGWWVDTLEDGIDVLRNILLPDGPPEQEAPAPFGGFEDDSPAPALLSARYVERHG